MITMNKYTLDLSQISQANQEAFKIMQNSFNTLELDECENIANLLDVQSVISDYQVLLNQLKDQLAQLSIKMTPKIVETINRAISQASFRRVPEVLSRAFNIDSEQTYEYITPKVMELCNIHYALDWFNNLPGTSGRAINIFKISELE